MTALLDLTPRTAGAAVLEPVVVFDEVEQALAGQERCPASCICHNHSRNCLITGRSFAE